MSGPVIVVAVVFVVVLAALGGLLATRRLVPMARLSRHTDVAGYIYAVIGVIYAVILAQVVIAAWEEYRDARDVAAVEASAVLNLDRLSRVWPDAEQNPVRVALIDYATHVVDVEWPAMAAGDYSLATGTVLVDDLWGTYGQIAQGPRGASANYANSLDQLDVLDQARRSRFLLGESSLPQTMMVTLLLGGVVTVGFSYLFAVDDGWLHGLMTSSLAVLVAMLLLLEYQLDSPFQGVNSIRPTAMRSVLADMGAPRTAPGELP